MSEVMATPPATKPARQYPVRVDSGHDTAQLQHQKVMLLRSCTDAVRSRSRIAVSYGRVMLADATFRFTCLDGRAEEMTGKAGQVPSFEDRASAGELPRANILGNCFGTEGLNWKAR